MTTSTRKVCGLFLAVMASAAGSPLRAASHGAETDSFTWYDVFTKKQSDEKTVFHGYAFFEYADQQKANGSFDQHVFEPFFGYQVTDDVFAKVIVEFEHVGAGEDATVNGKGNERTVEVEQAEIDITMPWKTATAGFGAILVPFGLENYYHAPSDNPLVTRPRAFVEGGIFPNTFTDPGIQFTQDLPRIGLLDLYVINGDARNGQVPRDSEPGGNNGKSYGGELQVSGLAGGLNIGASFIRGPWSEEGVFNPVTGSSESANSTRWGVHAEYKARWASITTEMVAGTDQRDSAVVTASGPKDRKVSGYYATLGVNPLEKLTLLVRSGSFDNDQELDKQLKTIGQRNRKNEISYGLRYQYRPGVLFKGEYRVTTEKPSVPDNLLAFQLSATF